FSYQVFNHLFSTFGNGFKLICFGVISYMPVVVQTLALQPSDDTLVSPQIWSVCIVSFSPFSRTVGFFLIGVRGRCRSGLPWKRHSRGSVAFNSGTRAPFYKEV